MLGPEVAVLSVSERVANMSRPSPSFPPLELDAVVLLAAVTSVLRGDPWLRFKFPAFESEAMGILPALTPSCMPT